MSKRKINAISVSDKLKIINEFEREKTRSEIMSEFNLPESTFYNILKNKKSIEVC